MAQVYAISSVDDQGRCEAIKIGVAENPHSRVKQLQTGSWQYLELIAVSTDMPRSLAELIERSALRMFKQLGMSAKGEWVFRRGGFGNGITTDPDAFAAWLSLGRMG